MRMENSGRGPEGVVTRREGVRLLATTHTANNLSTIKTHKVAINNRSSGRRLLTDYQLLTNKDKRVID